MPYPLEKGDKLRIYHQIKFLSEKNRIYLICLCEDDMEIERGKLELEKYCREIYFFKIPVWKRYAGLPFGPLYGQPFSVKYFYHAKTAKQIQKLILRLNPDHIFCQLIRTASYVRKLPFSKTIDYMDSFSLGFERRAKKSSLLLKPAFYLESKLLKGYEGSIYKDFNRHCIISKQDRDSLDILSRDNIEVIPNGVDQEFFYPKPDANPTFHLLFCGNMGYAPNIRAAHFLFSLAPVLISKIPGLKIMIAGARPHTSIKKMNGQYGIAVSGWMDDIRKAYWDSVIKIAPIFTGSGLQNKMLEAMACGIPCITTEVVGSSVGGVAGKHYLIASGKEEFVSQIVDLLEDSEKRSELSKNGLELIKEKFHWSFFSRKLETLLVESAGEEIF